MILDIVSKYYKQISGKSFKVILDSKIQTKHPISILDITFPCRLNRNSFNNP